MRKIKGITVGVSPLLTVDVEKGVLQRWDMLKEQHLGRSNDTLPLITLHRRKR